jgi:hypothetical protein
MWYTACLVTSLILIVISLLLLKESLAFLKTSERAVATVVELETVKGDDSDTYKAIFTFKTSSNEEITYRAKTSSSPAAWEVGEEALIAYDRDHPSTARLVTYFGIFSWSIILLSIAMPLLVIGGGYYLAQQVLR